MHASDRARNDAIAAWDDDRDLACHGGHLSVNQMEMWRDHWRNRARDVIIAHPDLVAELRREMQASHTCSTCGTWVPTCKSREDGVCRCEAARSEVNHVRPDFGCIHWSSIRASAGEGER
jgi:hypothetical protein